MQNHLQLRQLILDKLAELDPAGVAEAAVLCGQLPLEGMGHDVLAGDCLFQTAFAAERLQQYAAAELLYTRVLKYSDLNPQTVANTHYHLGVCLEAQAKLEAAIPHFQSAVESARDWPLVRQLARFHAAHLRMLAGDYAHAAAEFSILCEQDCCAELSDLDIRLRRLTCLLRSENFTRTDLADPVIDSLERFSGTVPALPQLAIDLALAAEEHSCYDLAERLYRTLIASTDIPPSFHANAWFRLGLVMDLRCNWGETEDCYRRALRHPHAWPELCDLARLHLADFLMTAEFYGDAADLFSEQVSQAKNCILPLPELRLREAVCRFRADDDEFAERILQEIREMPGCDTLLPKLEQLMADIYESRKDYKAAARCYEKLIQDPSSEVTVKVGALHRLNIIRLG